MEANMAAILRGRFGGAEVPMLSGISGGVTAGDLCVFSSGKLTKATGGNNAAAVLALAAETKADTAACAYYPLMPDVLISIPLHSGDTVTVGATYGLDATTLELSDDEASTYHRVRYWGMDPANSANALCTTTGWSVMA